MALRGLLAALVLAAALPALGQSDERASREREALRRAQAALQQAQQQVATLQAEQAAARRDAEASAAAASRAGADADALRRQWRAAQADAMRLAAERDAALQRADAAEQARLQAGAAATERERDLQRRLAAMQAERDERAQANGALTRLLEQAQGQLREARARNERLHAIGMEALERLRDVPSREAVGEPLFGLATVRVENEAEALRQRMDEQRQP